MAVGAGLLVAAVAVPAATADAGQRHRLSDPLERGRHEVARVDPFRAGLATVHEPDSGGGPAAGAASEIALQIRGILYRPIGRRKPSPLVVLVHGNHASCDAGSAPDCAIFKRNDAGYAYLAENLASWGYVVVSLDQDQLMARQDGPKGKGMHQRRLLIAALFDALYAANAPRIRIPLRDFARRGVDLSALRGLELRFGEEGMPAAGSIQLADVRFQEAAESTDVLVDSTRPGAGPATGPPRSGPDPADVLRSYDRAPGEVELPESRHNRWTVDDDRADCPGAEFTSIQQAVDAAAPWDTVVVCGGVYEERSGSYFGTPIPTHHTSNPVEAGSTNGLTITKPLRIKGAGAGAVTIRPAPSLGPSLAGSHPNLRDGGGNVITISRQSLGSSDDNEHFVHISGVTVASLDIYAEAGVAFLNASGRISDSVVGPLWRAADASELAARPHGWGVVMTNSLIGVGPGTVERQVTIDRSLVTGYQSGGIVFDASHGGQARSGIKT